MMAVLMKSAFLDKIFIDMDKFDKNSDRKHYYIRFSEKEDRDANYTEMSAFFKIYK